MSGSITLVFDDRALTINGELKDVSTSGLRVEHHCGWLKPGAVARIQRANQEKRVRVMWVRSFGDNIQSGLLHQDTYLITQALSGDQTAFADLIKPHLHGLQLVIQGTLRNSADAEDAVQETLFKVARHLAQFRAGNDFKPWLYRIAIREALKSLRWSRRHAHDPILQIEDDDESTHYLERVAGRGSSPVEILERKEFFRAVSVALRSLSEMYRQIFIACDIEQVPVKEAAGRLTINIDTANTRLHRARLLMRKRLREFYMSGSNSNGNGTAN